MTDPITRTQQENAAEDAATLEAVVNNAPGQGSIISRLGRALVALADVGSLAGYLPLTGDANVTGRKKFATRPTTPEMPEYHGAAGDATINTATGVVTGTDDTDALDDAHTAALGTAGLVYCERDYNCTVAPLNGFWGPGRIFENGIEIAIPRVPQRAGWLNAITANIPDVFDEGCICLMGDSISTPDGVNPDSIPIYAHWFDRFVRMITRIGQPGSWAEVTDLSPSSINLASYGITATGSTADGTTGPLGVSTVLEDGAKLSWTDSVGRCRFIGVNYMGRVSGGDILLKRNGSTIATISTDDDTIEHIGTLSTVTMAAGAVYELVASGGQVELTGWRRLGAFPDALARVPEFVRVSRSGYTSGVYTVGGGAALARRQSVLLHATRTGKTLILVAFGANDFGSTVAYATPDEYESRMGTIFEWFIQQGCYVAAISPVRPSPDFEMEVDGAVYEDYLSALKRAADKNSVPICRLDEVDFYGSDLLLPSPPPNVHPNADGHTVMLDLMCKFLATADFSQQSVDKQFRYRPRAMASLAGTATNVTGSGTLYTVALGSENFDVGEIFDLGNNRFVAPAAGQMKIDGQLYARAYGSPCTSAALLVVGSTFGTVVVDNIGPGAAASFGDLVLKCSRSFPVVSGETIQIKFQVAGDSGDAVDVISTSLSTSFGAEFTPT